jgi:hypothetical protein
MLYAKKIYNTSYITIFKNEHIYEGRTEAHEQQFFVK